MKQFAAVILALLYLSTSTGATVYSHFCMGKLAAHGWGENKSDSCANCGMEKKDNGCCKDEHHFLKNTADHKVSDAGFEWLNLQAPAIITSAYAYLPVVIPTETEKNPVSNAPPRSSVVAVYIFNSTFLI